MKTSKERSPRGLPCGKVPWDILSSHVQTPLSKEVRLGPAVGEDAALLKIGRETWALASDPITFTSRDAGRLAVIVNANDVAVRGAKPLLFSAVVLLPPGIPVRDAERMLDQVRDTCLERRISLVGGHTEVTAGLPHVLIAGTMLGRVIKKPVTTGGLRNGDWIGMTRWAGLEGTAILLREHPGACRGILGPRAFREASESAKWEHLCVVPEALAAAKAGASAMHDVTEGGVGEALFEMARASGRELEVFRDLIPCRRETEKLCHAFGIDPMGLIGSGALLVGCGPDGKRRLERALSRLEVPLAWIARAKGRSADPGTGFKRFERDEILKALTASALPRKGRRKKS